MKVGPAGVVAIVALAAACRANDPPPPSTPVASASVSASAANAAPTHGSYAVLWKNENVLTITDEPGPLLSTALPPPGFKPPTHRFLSGTAHDAMHEGKLRALLDASTSFDDYVRRLRDAGYDVKRQ